MTIFTVIFGFLSLCLSLFSLFFGCTLNMWKFPDQGLNLWHSSDPSHWSDNIGSLTCCTTRELILSLFFFFLCVYIYCRILVCSYYEVYIHNVCVCVCVCMYVCVDLLLLLYVWLQQWDFPFTVFMFLIVVFSASLKSISCRASLVFTELL